MDYYIDGTIDSIKIDTGAASIEFSLLPSSEFLKTVSEGKKRALFINKQADSAFLQEVEKNEGGKEICNFKLSHNRDSSRKCLLLEAKNNRNTIRVFVKEKVDKKSMGNIEKQRIPAIDFSTASSIQFL